MTYVNSLATVARGVTVTIDGTKIGEILEIPIPSTEVDDIEVTNQDSGDWKEYKPGRKDGGEAELKANFVSSDAGQLALQTACAGTATHVIVVSYPDGSSMTFNGVVKTFDVTLEDDLLKLSCKIKVSGEPIFATTNSALTGLTITGQTLKPTFGAAKYNYTVDVLTAVDNVVVVPVQAAAGASITVNGIATPSGNSGNLDTDLGAAGSVTDIAVTVREASKTAKTYFIHVYRA